MQALHREANDQLVGRRIALEDLDGEIAKLESEIDSVRGSARSVTGRCLQGGTVNAKQLNELQHELETLERRQASLEDSLLEVMERREELQRAAVRAPRPYRRPAERVVGGAQLARDAALVDIDERASGVGGSACRADVAAERGPGGPLREAARRWRARSRSCCRVNVAGLAVSRSIAVRWPGSRPPPTTRCCGARNAERSCCGSNGGEGGRRGRRRSRGNPGPAGYGAVVFSGDRSAVLAERKESIGRATNNVAEYRGLIAGLDRGGRTGCRPRWWCSWTPSWWWSRCRGAGGSSIPTCWNSIVKPAQLAAPSSARSSTAGSRGRRTPHADRLANEAMDAAAAPAGGAGLTGLEVAPVESRPG